MPSANVRQDSNGGVRKQATMAEPRKSTQPSLPSANAQKDLDDLRVKIDEVDRSLLEYLNRRANLVLEVGRVKESSGASVYEEAREKRIVKGLVELNPGPFPDAGLGPVFREIISATRSLEQGVLIAYMGPEGTFSHLAANQKFGRMAGLSAVPTISDVFAAVERETAELGVVPVENTTEGVVTQTLDTFVDADVSICGEVLLPIAYDLASRTGRVEDVKQVASHPQSLAQCRDWLDRNLPGIDRIETVSTTAAALLAVDDESLAAVCSPVAAEKYGLSVSRQSIQDRIDNTTRFLVIGKQTPRPTGNDLTSAVFTIRKDEPGGLHRLLQPFAAGGINLTSIHLRPIKGKPWEYLFFLELEGHRNEERVETALASVASIAHSHRVLGSFPRAESPAARERGD
jgi:chorismate mutase/prephenate dehydratase